MALAEAGGAVLKQAGAAQRPRSRRLAGAVRPGLRRRAAGLADGGGRRDVRPGPSSWDGYAATVVAESCLEALRTGSRTSVSLRERPDFYAKAQ